MWLQKCLYLQFCKLLFLSIQFKFQFNILWNMTNSVEIPAHELKGRRFLMNLCSVYYIILWNLLYSFMHKCYICIAYSSILHINSKKKKKKMPEILNACVPALTRQNLKILIFCVQRRIFNSVLLLCPMWEEQVLEKRRIMCVWYFCNK